MSIPLIINGVTFQFPEANDTDWGSTATSWASAVTSGMLQKSGGTFSLLNDLNFGANYGLTSKYYRSGSAAIALAGVFRLNKTDTINYRNNAGTADLALGINGSDRLIFDSNPLLISSDLVASAVTNTPSGNLVATDVQTALNELQSDIDTRAVASDFSNHINDTSDAHDASAISSVASGNLVATDVQSALNELQSDIDTREVAANKGAANGYCPLGADTKISSTYLPSYVDDVVEVANFAALPVTGEAGKIYVTLDDNLTYRWSGSVYAEISKSLALGTTSTTAFRGDYGNTAYGHSQATSNIHGVTNVVGATEYQTIVNKNIDGGTASNDVKITLPSETLANLQSLTRKEGTVVYATDTDKIYYDDGSNLNVVGAGSGVGASDIWGILKSDDDAGTWTTGNNATFLGAGDISGTFTKQSSSSPLNGAYSYLYTQSAGSLNDFVASPTIAVPLRSRNASTTATNILRITYTYDGGTNDIQLVVWDVTNSAKLTSLSQTFKSNLNPYQKNEFLFEVPSNCASVRVGTHTLVANAGKVLKFDDIELSDKPFGMVSTVEVESARYNTHAGYSSTNNKIPYFANIGENSVSTIGTISNSATTGWSFTASKKCKVQLGYSGTVTTSGYLGVSLNSTELSTAIQAIADSYRVALDYGGGTGEAATAFASVNMNAGDVIRPHSSGFTPNNNGNITLTFNATAVSENIIQSWQPSDCIGEIKYLPQNVAPQGFLPANGSIIGLSSGSHQGNTYYDLYNVLWNVAQTTAGEPYVISSAKGASASADWAAGKTIKIDESGLFTRAYLSGTTGAVGAKQPDAFQGHQHQQGHSAAGGSTPYMHVGAAQLGTSSGVLNTTVNTVSDGTNGTPRTSTETRPTNVAKYAFIRYATAQPTLLALPTSKENVFGSSFDSTPTRLFGNADWYNSITKNTTGSYTIDYTKLGLVSAPRFSIIPSANAFVFESSKTSTAITFLFRTDNGTAIDSGFDITLFKNFPDYQSLGVFVGNVSPIAPTIQKFTSGSGTYTLPTTNGFKPTYIRVRMVGGGGGGGGSSNNGVNNLNSGSAGAQSSFGELYASGGSAGTTHSSGAGGSAGSPQTYSKIALVVVGDAGGAPTVVNGALVHLSGGNGGGSHLGGGASCFIITPSAAVANTGGGGAGGGCGYGSGYYGAGGGGGGGGYIEAIINNPASSYSYTVGTGGAGGVGQVTTGSAGGSGYIEVTEYYF